MACSVIAFKTMEIGNLATYTLVLQMGGMVLPFLYGMLLGGDGHTWQKWVCLALISVALFVNMSKTESRGRSSAVLLVLYAVMFLLNGSACIIFAVHGEEAYGTLAVDSTSFTLWYMILTSLFCFAIGAVLRLKEGNRIVGELAQDFPKNTHRMMIRAGQMIRYGGAKYSIVNEHVVDYMPGMHVLEIAVRHAG